MTCPYCGASESFVARSRAGIENDAIRRRRECASCGKRFPTWERVDREGLERELEGAPAATVVFPMPAPTWDNVDALLHRLWGQAKDGEYVKADWCALQQLLAALRPRH